MPHDGVAALAGPALSTPAVPTPPTRVSVVAAASTLLLMDMDDSSLGTCGRALRTTASSRPPRHARPDGFRPDSARCRHYGGLIRAGTADLIGWCSLERESPGQARKFKGQTLAGRLNGKA